MAVGDNIGINPGSGAAVTADLVTRTGDAQASLTQFVKIMDGTDGSIYGLIIGADGAARTKDVGVSTSAKNYALNTAFGTWSIIQAGGSNLAGRTTVHIQNYSDVAVEFSFTGAATALGQGTIIPAGQAMSFSLADTLNAYIQPVSGTGKRVNIIEAN